MLYEETCSDHAVSSADHILATVLNNWKTEKINTDQQENKACACPEPCLALPPAISNPSVNAVSTMPDPITGELPFAAPVLEFWQAAIGKKLLGNEVDDVNRAAQRLVQLVRQYPFRPYRIQGGGSGIGVPRGWATKTPENWALYCEFSDLWWSAAGDALIERFGNKIRILSQNSELIAADYAISGIISKTSKKKKK